MKEPSAGFCRTSARRSRGCGHPASTFMPAGYVLHTMDSGFQLMHKSVHVADVAFDESWEICKTRNIQAPEHMPYGTFFKGMVDGIAMRSWWRNRAIPATRDGLDNLLWNLGFDDMGPLVVRSMGLSLSDHYWMRPAGSELQWSDVNFFDNEFSDDIGDVLFGNKIVSGELDFRSPDNTSDGVLKKRWKIIDGDRCLIKGADSAYCQEPFNEVLASKAMDLLGIPHVEYTLLHDRDSFYSVCKDMVTCDTELVPAARALLATKMPNNTSYHDHYVAVCRDHGLDIIGSLDMMLVLDFLISNRDRHYNNFGIIRDAESLEWISSAPIYDSGSSMGSDLPTDLFIRGRLEECKPFSKSFCEQMKLVSSTDWLDREALKSLPALVEDVFSDSNGWTYAERTKVLVDLVESRIDRLD